MPLLLLTCYRRIKLSDKKSSCLIITVKIKSKNRLYKLFNELVMMAITHEVILCYELKASNINDPDEYSHYPRVKYYTFSTTMKRN
jgi:hypothetical protein